MESILPTEEYTEVDGRAYLNPQVALDESNTFIDNLRATQGQQNQEIISDTQMLGTDVPSNLGGLTGAESYFTSRYQTPQTNSVVANLRAVAQAAALNQVLANEQEIWKKRYNDAYRAYQKRANSGGGSGGGGGGVRDEGEDPDYVSTDKIVGSAEPQFSPAGSGTFMFTPKTLGGAASGSSLGGGNSLNINTNTLTPAGTVNIVRNRGGGIESLTYNGKTFTGDAAKNRYNFLLENGSLSRVEE